MSARPLTQGEIALLEPWQETTTFGSATYLTDDLHICAGPCRAPSTDAEGWIDGVCVECRQHDMDEQDALADYRADWAASRGCSSSK